MKKFKKAKREKARWVFARAIAAALALACAFAVGFQIYLHETIKAQCRYQITANTNSHLQKISDIVSKKENDEDIFREVNSRLAIYTHYEIMLYQFGLFDPDCKNTVQIAANYSDGCHAAAALVDSEGNIVASNKRKLIAFIMWEKKLEDDPERGFYLCDCEKLNMPEVDELFEEYQKLSGEDKKNTYITLKADSFYINRKDHTFVPHKGKFVIENYKSSGVFKDEENGQTYLTDKTEIKETTKEFEIDINNPDFELTKVHQGISSENSPRYALFNFWGDENEAFDLFEGEFTQSDESSASHGYTGKGNGTAVFADNTSLNINKGKYTLMMRYTVNYLEPAIVKYYWTYTILVAVLLLVIALLYAWRRNVVNKAKYAMDDYQRDLTNILAHDIKTPLTAIGGYAENILDGRLTEEEQQKYLRSILDNVAFTDSMVNRTLQLNNMNGQKLSREKINVAELLDDAVKKYKTMLEENNITFISNGSAEIKTNRSSLDTIIENLISNAVKYTTENGRIKAELDKKRLVITNTVASKIDVKELKKPFVRGDASRSNIHGSGLGLTLAERSAQLCGMTIKLSCSDSEFRAELKF